MSMQGTLTKLIELLWHILLKFCSRISTNIKFSGCSQALLVHGTIISPMENLEKKKCNLDYLVFFLIYNKFTYSVL